MSFRELFFLIQDYFCKSFIYSLLTCVLVCLALIFHVISIYVHCSPYPLKDTFIFIIMLVAINIHYCGWPYFGLTIIMPHTHMHAYVCVCARAHVCVCMNVNILLVGLFTGWVWGSPTLDLIKWSEQKGSHSWQNVQVKLVGTSHWLSKLDPSSDFGSET